ncbi:MAG: hypothetical protein ACTHK7_21700, partial [Aureliella sp.]
CFHVHSFGGGPPVGDVLELCESLRTELRRVWGPRGDAPWAPRCEVVLHPSLASYLGAVGPGAAQTKGCSTIELHSGRISKRRIDLRIEPDGALSALPHELTHIVLADRFGGQQPPHWLDEGIAMLADTRDKQFLHARDCHDALASGRSLPLGQLLNFNGFSSADQMPAFYGQSLSLVQMLARQDNPQRVVDFAVDSMNHGYPRALQKHYGIGSIDELEARWRAFAASQAQSPHRPLVTVRFKP